MPFLLRTPVMRPCSKLHHHTNNFIIRTHWVVFVTDLIICPHIHMHLTHCFLSGNYCKSYYVQLGELLTYDFRKIQGRSKHIVTRSSLHARSQEQSRLIRFNAHCTFQRACGRVCNVGGKRRKLETAWERVRITSDTIDNILIIMRVIIDIIGALLPTNIYSD